VKVLFLKLTGLLQWKRRLSASCSDGSSLLVVRGGSVGAGGKVGGRVGRAAGRVGTGGAVGRLAGTVGFCGAVGSILKTLTTEHWPVM